MKIIDLDEQVTQLTKQLETESCERKAAENTVLDLITLHLKVSELRERLARETQSGADLKVNY
jgi:regulator of replication initiation timing